MAQTDAVAVDAVSATARTRRRVALGLRIALRGYRAGVDGATTFQMGRRMMSMQRGAVDPGHLLQAWEDVVICGHEQLLRARVPRLRFVWGANPEACAQMLTRAVHSAAALFAARPPHAAQAMLVLDCMLFVLEAEGLREIVASWTNRPSWWPLWTTLIAIAATQLPGEAAAAVVQRLEAETEQMDASSRKRLAGLWLAAVQACACRASGSGGDRTVQSLLWVEHFLDKAVMASPESTQESLSACDSGNVLPSLLNAAAESGSLELLRFLERAGCGATTKAMDVAAENGHLDVLRYLHENRREGCTWSAMDRAATAGQLETLEFLVRHRSSSRLHFTQAAANGAAANGHLTVLEYVLRVSNVRCTLAGCDDAAASGHEHVVAYLLRRAATQGSGHASFSSRGFDWACANGHLQIAEMLFEAGRRIRGTTDALEQAALHGHLAVCEFLVNRVKERISTRAVGNAVSAKHENLAKFLHAALNQSHPHPHPRSGV